MNVKGKIIIESGDSLSLTVVIVPTVRKAIFVKTECRLVTYESDEVRSLTGFFLNRIGKRLIKDAKYRLNIKTVSRNFCLP